MSWRSFKAPKMSQHVSPKVEMTKFEFSCWDTIAHLEHEFSPQSLP